METTQEVPKEPSVEPTLPEPESDSDSEDFKRKRSKSNEENNESITEQTLESGELGEIFEAGEIPSSPVKTKNKKLKSKSKKFIEESPQESSITTNLFVNYIPLEYTDQDLKKLFTDVGAIESAKVMLDLATGQSKGFGFVKFKTINDAREAIKSLHGKKLNNKTLVVKYAESGGNTTTPHGTPSTNVYIKALPHTMTDEQLYTLFSPYGTIIKHKILKDLNSGLSKGQAFVEFEDMKSAEYAIAALNGFLFPDTHKGIVVRFADTETEKQQRKMKTNRRKQMSDRFSPYDVNVPTNSGPPSNNLFVYHLPHSADDALLYKLFSPFGAILQVKVMRDSGGKCKGFGFVMMANWISAYNAIQGLNGYKVENKHLQVSFKK